MVTCIFGGPAKDGDVVVCRKSKQYSQDNLYLGIVKGDKVYTGQTDGAKRNKKTGRMEKTFIHCTGAVCVVDPQVLNSRVLNAIYFDMQQSLPDYDGPAPALNWELYCDLMALDHIDRVWDCFPLCADEEELEKFTHRLKYAYGGCFGNFTYEVAEEGGTFTVTNYYDEHGTEQTETREFEFWD